MADETPDEDFLRQYNTHDSKSTDFIKRHSRTKAELREIIDFLIRHRELVRDIELQKLESESQKLLKRLREIDDQKLASELMCFKDVLALQQRLSEYNDDHLRLALSCQHDDRRFTRTHVSSTTCQAIGLLLTAATRIRCRSLAAGALPESVIAGGHAISIVPTAPAPCNTSQCQCLQEKQAEEQENGREPPGRLRVLFLDRSHSEFRFKPSQAFSKQDKPFIDRMPHVHEIPVCPVLDKTLYFFSR